MATRASVQVMIDSGVTRSGVCVERLGELLDRVATRPSMRLAGLCTHFSNAEDPASEVTTEQLARFRACTGNLPPVLRRNVVRHAANSAATLFRPDAHFDMVRPGLALY